jgi:hypothetical protein
MAMKELPPPIIVKTWIDCMRYKSGTPEDNKLINNHAVKKILNVFGTIENLATYMKHHGLK